MDMKEIELWGVDYLLIRQNAARSKNEKDTTQTSGSGPSQAGRGNSEAKSGAERIADHRKKLVAEGCLRTELTCHASHVPHLKAFSKVLEKLPANIDNEWISARLRRVLENGPNEHQRFNWAPRQKDEETANVELRMPRALLRVFADVEKRRVDGEELGQALGNAMPSQCINQSPHFIAIKIELDETKNLLFDVTALRDAPGVSGWFFRGFLSLLRRSLREKKHDID